MLEERYEKVVSLSPNFLDFQDRLARTSQALKGLCHHLIGYHLILPYLHLPHFQF